MPQGSPPAPRSAAADLEDLRERLERSGAAALDTAECLAFALRRGAGRAALGWAERLLAEFGSLPELLGAPPVRLRAAATPAIARDIEVLHDLQLRALKAPLRLLPVLGDRDAVADYLRVALAAERREQVRALFLDRGLRLLADERMGQGSVEHAPLYPREVVRRALELDASGLVLVRNHPAGRLEPTAADLESARQVIAAARALRIAVHDQLLVVGRAVISFRDRGLL
jgi:DNA repair protein RadC